MEGVIYTVIAGVIGLIVGLFMRSQNKVPNNVLQKEIDKKVAENKLNLLELKRIEKEIIEKKLEVKSPEEIEKFWNKK